MLYIMEIISLGGTDCNDSPLGNLNLNPAERKKYSVSAGRPNLGRLLRHARLLWVRFSEGIEIRGAIDV